MTFLPRSFFSRTPLSCARELTGAMFHWRACVVRIVETEAYDALGDPACHTFTRPSTRRFLEENPPGTAYVYLNYGVHWLFNILVKGGSRSGFVLVRAIEFLKGPLLPIHPRAGAGPGKATRLLGIDGSIHGLDLYAPNSPARFALSPTPPPRRIRSPRIGISRAQDLLWRFSIRDHPAVSVKPEKTTLPHVELTSPRRIS